MLKSVQTILKSCI